MALETNITERDKKLLVFLAIFLIGMGSIWFIIKPGIDDIMNKNIEISKAESAKNKIAYSIKMTSKIVQEIQDMKGELKKSDSIIYNKLNSQQVDNLITSLTLKRGFSRNDIRDLTIDYPKMYTVVNNYMEEETVDSKQSTEDETVSPNALTGIYSVGVKFSVYGTREQIQPLINTIENDYDAIRITSYNWEADNIKIGYYTTTIEMNVYMTDNEE